jgi:hypothetical protein
MRIVEANDGPKICPVLTPVDLSVFSMFEVVRSFLFQHIDCLWASARH